MTWPQLVIATWFMWLFVGSVIEMARDRELSSGEAAIGALISIAEIVGAAIVLSIGGFW